MNGEEKLLIDVVATLIIVLIWVRWQRSERL